MVWSCGEERKRGLGEEMLVYEGGRCKANGRSSKTWLEVVKNDMKGLGLYVDAVERHA